ncbi:MAG: 30S ribosomal protein S6 [bacterium]
MEKEKKTNEKEDMLTVYEVSYLLLPSLAEEQVPAKMASIRDAVEKVGGEVISFENPILIDLAYPMTKVVLTVRTKCQKAYFGWMKFEMSKEGIEAVKKALDANDDVLRYLIIKTVRENTLVSGKMMLKKEEQVKKLDETADEIPPEELSTPEEIDKSIDDLVIA